MDILSMIILFFGELIELTFNIKCKFLRNAILIFLLIISIGSICFFAFLVLAFIFSTITFGLKILCILLFGSAIYFLSIPAVNIIFYFKDTIFNK